MDNILRFVDHWKQTRPYELSIVCLWGLWPKEREAEIARVVPHGFEQKPLIFRETHNGRSQRHRRDPPKRQICLGIVRRYVAARSERFRMKYREGS